MQQTALLHLSRYELPATMYWVSAKRLIIAKGRQMGSREQPSSMGEIIATDFDGKNQKYVYGWEQSTRTAGIDRGFGYIEGLPEVPNGHFYMRRLSMDTGRSQLYDVDAEKTTARLVADIPVKDLSFTLDRQGVPRFASGTDDNNNYLLYAADSQGENWKQIQGADIGGKFVPFAFSTDGQSVFANFSKDGGPFALVKSDISGKNQQVLAADDFGSVGDVEWTAAPYQPFAATLGEGKPRMVYFDEKSPEAQLHQTLSRSFPDKYVTYVNHSTDGNISPTTVDEKYKEAFAKNTRERREAGIAAPWETEEGYLFAADLNTPRRLATLAMMLADRRHSAARIEKILGGNLMRVFGETWKARDSG
jgi:hypothetical protein